MLGQSQMKKGMGTNFSLRFGFIFAALCLCPSLYLFAQEQPNNSLEILATYDYPGAIGYINSSGINSQGDVAGYFAQPNGDFRGFFRYHDGTFSAPIVAPNDTNGFTYVTDINSTPTVCGESFVPAKNAYHGFLLTNRVFTLFDIEGAGSTTVAGINAWGHFVGDFGPDATTTQGYINVDGVITSFSIPDATVTVATAINGLDMVVGNYIPADLTTHGFFRNLTGELTYPVDFPGSILTGLRGINDHGLVVGVYEDSNGVSHGLVFKPPATFLSYTYPGSTYTTLGGINNRGLICGDYKDSTGILRHGFIGRIR